MTADQVEVDPGATIDVFTYWNDASHAPLRGLLAAWRPAFPRFRVVGPDEAAAALDAVRPGFSALFARIRIAACRSDLARLAILDARGGLYVDARCGFTSAAAVQSLWSEFQSGPHAFLMMTHPLADWSGGIRPLNSVLMAKPNAAACRAVLEQCMANVAAHADNPAPYNIFTLTGPHVYYTTLLEIRDGVAEARAPFRGTLRFVPLRDACIVRYRSAYDLPSEHHWSEQQKHVPLLRA